MPPQRASRAGVGRGEEIEDVIFLHVNILKKEWRQTSVVESLIEVDRAKPVGQSRK